MTDEPRRQRNALATREAILQSALILFARSGYDGVGVREIALAAGVTGVLVNRYFGSKEELFAATVELAFADNALFTEDREALVARVASAIASKTAADAGAIDPLMLLLHSASNPRAAQIMRDSIARHFESPLIERLQGRNKKERAALFLAVIAGFQLMRKVLANHALADASDAALAKQLESLLNQVFSG